MGSFLKISLHTAHSFLWFHSWWRDTFLNGLPKNNRIGSTYKKIKQVTRKHSLWMFVDFFENLERLKIPNLWKQHHQSHPNSGGFKVGLNLKSSWQNTWIQNLPRANSTVTSLWHVGPVCFEHFGGVYKDIWVVGEGFLENHISCKRTCRINCIPPTPPPTKADLPTQTRKKHMPVWSWEVFSVKISEWTNLFICTYWGHFHPHIEWPKIHG